MGSLVPLHLDKPKVESQLMEYHSVDLLIYDYQVVCVLVVCIHKMFSRTNSCCLHEDSL